MSEEEFRNYQDNNFDFQDYQIEQLLESNPHRLQQMTAEERTKQIILNNLNPSPEMSKKTEYQKKKKSIIDKKKTVIAVAGAVIIITGAILGSDILAQNIAEGVTNNQIKAEAQETFPNFNNDTTYTIYAEGTEEVQYAYDNAKVAQMILNYNGPKDIHSVIYSCFKLYKYDQSKQMDELFKLLSIMIETTEYALSPEKIAALKRESFANYLKAFNYKDVDTYISVMNIMIMQYSDDPEEGYTLEEDPSVGGR